MRFLLRKYIGGTKSQIFCLHSENHLQQQPTNTKVPFEVVGGNITRIYTYESQTNFNTIRSRRVVKWVMTAAAHSNRSQQ